MRHKTLNFALASAPIGLALALSNVALGQEMLQPPQQSYADLIDLSDPAQIVLKAQIRKQATLEPERAPGLASGFVRLYIEAQTKALLSGSVPVGESLKYLVDVRADAKGRAPKLRKKDVLIFARPVAGRPGEIQLVAPSSQLMWTSELEQRLRPILSDLVKTGTPPHVTGIRDAFSIEGNLAGESETQIFLSTQSGSPVSISVIRKPGQPPIWGVSWSEIIDQAAKPPIMNTLEWYRLACFLPQAIPAPALMSNEADARRRTQTDYRYVLSEMGDCPRNPR